MFHHCFENQQNAPISGADDLGTGASKLSALAPSFLNHQQQQQRQPFHGWFGRNSNNSNTTSQNQQHSPDTPKSLDAALAEGLQNLSMEELDKANFELHGVAPDPIQETPELQAESLQYFDECLDILKFDPHLPTDAYRLAETMSSEYVHREDVRLRFLRLVEFQDIRAAAKRFIRFFDFKSQMFGPEKLVKEITFDDLPPADQKAFKKGYIQVSQHRDRGDRPIVIFFTCVEDYDCLEQLVSFG